jgi:hypothetical protein
MDGLAQIESGRAGNYVLYTSGDSRIRSQLGSVKAGNFRLDKVFPQKHGRGRAEELRTVDVPGGFSLPLALCINAPADPAALLNHYSPKWIAVDCSDGHELTWLPGLLLEAHKRRIPLVGWTTRPFAGAVTQWLEAGGGVFRWPRLRQGATTQVTDLKQLSQWALQAEVTPRVLVGENVLQLSKAFAAATEALLAARASQDGRLSRDAVMLGWRYLRAMEALPVPLEVYEREANSYWGIRRISDLAESFDRFVQAVRALSPKLYSALQNANEALSSAYQQLRSTDTPLWRGLANLCVDSTGQRRIVFASKSRQEMFSFCLLARFNISEDDLREVGVELGHLSDAADTDAYTVLERAGSKTAATSRPPLFVGIPSHFAEKRIYTLFESGRLEVLLWPHQEPILEKRIRHLSSELTLASQNLGRVLPTLNQHPASAVHPPMERRPLTLGQAHVAPAGALGDELQSRAESVSLWKRPDASEAIEHLFGAAGSAEDDEGSLRQIGATETETEPGAQANAEQSWVQEAVDISLEGGLHVLLPLDEQVNVIVRVPTGAQVEQRYVRSLREGDELLFIQGQRRQSLYELLVSRVHRDPVIAQYLALVNRWQDDVVRAFSEAARKERTTPETLLHALQSRGSGLTSGATIRTWLKRQVLAPNDAGDLKRIAEVLSMRFVADYYRQIDKAGKRLKGLHISLSTRLNRWLASSGAGTIAAGGVDEVIDDELGLTVDDFRHSLLRVRVLALTQQRGPFYRPNLGRLEGAKT